MVQDGRSSVAASRRNASDDEQRLDDEQIAHLRHFTRLADQIPGDWAQMGTFEPGQEGDDALRYQLAMMSYAIGAAQYHRTPAWREHYRGIFEQLIEKMLRFDVWSYWETASRGSKVFDPDLEELGKGWLDPVVRQNIMYSGHLFKMVGLYEMLYRTGRYNAPGSLSFEFKPVFRGVGPETFAYDHKSLGQAILKEFERNDYLGCECEPNAIFVVCNQTPLLGFHHHDHVHGTEIAPFLIQRFEDAWKKRSNLFKSTCCEELPVYISVRQEEVLEGGLTDAWWCAMMHPWKPDYTESVYPNVRKRLVRPMPDGTLGVDDTVYNRSPDSEVGDLAVDPIMLGVQTFGLMALAASEMGDAETLAGMLDYAEKYFAPDRREGCLYYPRNDAMGTDNYVTCLIGNALLPWARLNVADGLWRLYNDPWDDAHFAEPTVEGIDFPAVLVRRAAFDALTEQLTLAVEPSAGAVERTSFRIEQLDRTKPWRVVRDDTDLGAAGADGSSSRWIGENRLEISTALSAETRFEIAMS